MKFAKMHGLGNDFIVLQADTALPQDLGQLAKRLCDRRTGIGGDGVLVLGGSDAGDISMRIINSDGSEAEMCGNGIRCAAKYAFEHGLVESPLFTVETLAGLMVPELQLKNGKVTGVKVNMGRPEFQRQKIPVAGTGTCIGQRLEVLDREFECTTLLMGVPHTVVFVDEINEADVLKYGPAIETHPMFPKKTNVDFVQVLDKGNIAMRTWERGAGRTLACGTGACASAVACALEGFTGRRADVWLELGVLSIEWTEEDIVYMTGPAETAFTGELSL